MSETEIKTFAAEKDAIIHAHRMAKATGEPYAVVASPHHDHPGRPYCVEQGDGGLIRSFEKLVKVCHPPRRIHA